MPDLQLPDWLGAARQTGFLTRLPDSLVHDLLEGSHRIEYPAGALASRWDDRRRAAIVVRGSIRTFISSLEGGQITLSYLRVGDLVMTLDSRISRGIQAIEISEMLYLDEGRLTSLAEHEAILATAVREEAIKSLVDTQRWYAIRAFGTIRLRVANAILDRALSSGGLIQDRLVAGTQSELANAVGSVREVVATALQQLKREGIISIRRGGVTILDPQGLHKVADGRLGLGPPAPTG